MILRTSKSIGSQHHEKNATRYRVLALLITGCAQQTFTVQNKPAAVAPKETITHHFVSGIGQKKTVDGAVPQGGAENAVKQKPSKHSQMDCSVLLL